MMVVSDYDGGRDDDAGDSDDGIDGGADSGGDYECY
jgi:hypothetical protein